MPPHFLDGYVEQNSGYMAILTTLRNEPELSRLATELYGPSDQPLQNENQPIPEEDLQIAERLMTAQQQISTARLAKKVGQSIDVIIDDVDDEGAIGRSKGDAPEIDGAVYLNGDTDVQIGDIVRATVKHADEYDLWAIRED